MFLEADTLLMNLTEGMNSNLEKKTATDYEIERLVALSKFKAAEEKLSQLKSKKWLCLKLEQFVSHLIHLN